MSQIKVVLYRSPLCLFGLALVLVLYNCQSAFADNMTSDNSAVEKRQPNILMIVADDMGYTDMGNFGGEIHTPSLDALANSGVRLTDFHAAATCSPTRSMLLSGTDNHLAGLGNMIERRAPNQVDKPGYEGYLTPHVVSIATLLRDAGYHTYMAGKWHLGLTSDQAPSARGFDRSFALLNAGASHFADGRGLTSRTPKATYRDNGHLLEKLPEGFYSSEFYTDRIIDDIDRDHRDGRPFFAYLSYTAPHWPLQAPDNFIDRYRGVYDKGYDVLRRQRLANAKRLGLLSKGVEGVPRAEGVPAWDELSLEQQKIEARKMEVYAAMIESLDDNLGRLVDYLKSINEFDNTFIVFLSDNGPEGADRSKLRGNDVWIPKTFDNSYNNMGRVNSYIYPGVAWAQVSAAPLRLYKSFVSEGGIRVPAFVSYRGVKQKGSIHSGFLSVMDIAPTLVELAGAEPPSTHYNGLKIHPFKGTSMLAFLSGKSQFIHRQDYVMGWELFGHRAIRQGDWKLLWLSSKPSWLTLSGTTDQWGLYNLSTDPAEMNDLSGSEPEKFAEMKAYWHQYVRDNNVVLPQWGSR